MKQDWKPGTMIYPLPALLVSCGSTPEDYNLFTVAWAGADLYQSGHVLHLRTTGATLLRAHQAEHGVCSQSDNRRHGVRHGLVRRAFGARLP